MSNWPPNNDSALHMPAKPPLAKVTLGLIFINVMLFGWQILSGVDISSPEIADAIHWGADYAPLTLLQEPYRLFSSMFFHFGLPHLMFNMWALYIFGNLAEQTFGRVYFLAMYVLAGLMGSLLSAYVDIHNSYTFIENIKDLDGSLLPRVSAGASGAVMGIGGALTALAFFPRLARQQMALDKRSLLTIIGINLVFGILTSGINNAAHVGGMIMGALLAIAWYAVQHFKLPKVMLAIILLLGALLCYAAYQYCLMQIEPIMPLWQEALNNMQQQLGR